MTNNEQIVRDFLAAWGRLDINELMGYFSEDAVYHNIPWPPAIGRAAIRQVLEGFFKDLNMTSAKFEVRYQMAAGNIVMNERMDQLIINGKKVALPVAGVFEIEKGKIKAWRDYFDAATFNDAMAA